MSKRTTLLVSVGLFVVVVWYWGLWPGLGYLQVRDSFESVSAADMWRQLVVGPLVSEFRVPQSSALQWTLQIGNWLFGYVILALAALTTGRMFDDRRANRWHVASYSGLLVWLLAFLVFGGATTSAEAPIEGSNVVEASTTSVFVTPKPETNDEWSLGFKALQDQVMLEIRSGASVLLDNPDRYALYTVWAERAKDVAGYFLRASDGITELLSRVDEEGRPDSYKRYFVGELQNLQRLLISSIAGTDRLESCARTSNRDGDCQDELDAVLNSVRDASTEAIAR